MLVLLVALSGVLLSIAGAYCMLDESWERTLFYAFIFVCLRFLGIMCLVAFLIGFFGTGMLCISEARDN